MDSIWLVTVFLGSLVTDLASSVMASSDPALEEASLMPRLMVATLGVAADLVATTAQELAMVIGLVMLFLATGAMGGTYLLLTAVSVLHLAAGINNVRIGGAFRREKSGGRSR